MQTVDRAWLALKITCNRDKEKCHTKSEVNRNPFNVDAHVAMDRYIIMIKQGGPKQSAHIGLAVGCRKKSHGSWRRRKMVPRASEQ